MTGRPAGRDNSRTIEKLVTFEGYDRQGPHIFPLETTSVRLIKLATALHPDVQGYINKAKPVPGKTQMLIDALGAAEYWGQNVNGDLFPEAALEHDGPDYGAKTFELYGHPFKHHVNKDPARAYGDKVAMARYHKPTGRVQLIVAYHNDKAKDIIEDVDEGNYPAVSMGARVPFDVCTICGNRAKTRANYCEHAKFMMGKILGDGRQVGVVNTMPKFFDISVVLVGAEKASHVLKKVAYAKPAYRLGSAEAWDKLSGVKAAVQTKDADIDKSVPSNVPKDEQVRPVSELMDAATDVKNTESTISPEKLDQMAGLPMKEIFSTLAALGIPLKPHEFQRIMLVKIGRAALAQQLWNEDVVFNEAAGTMPKNAGDMTFDVQSVNEKLAFLLRPHLADRSVYPELLEARVDNFEKRAEDWYNSKKKAQSSSSYQALLPVMITMAGAYRMFKDRLPEVQRGAFDRAIEAHPWLLPLLIGAGVASAAAARTALAPIQLHAQGPFDQSDLSKYSADKSASWKRLGVIPAAYAYSGVQRHRAMRGDHLNWLDRKVAERPELAALGSFIAAPKVIGAAKKVGLLKGASLAGDAAMMSFASGPKFIPGVLAGLAIDLGVVKGLQGIARRRRHATDHA